MTTYSPPTQDMQFVINELADLQVVAGLPAYVEQEVSPDLVDAILVEGSKLASEVLAPLNKVGDEQGARLGADGVKVAEGFTAAYNKFVEGGWVGVAAPLEYGGQGLPELVLSPLCEMWQAANMSFALCPMLTAGASELLRAHSAEHQPAIYMEKLVSGEWTGTMNLTEPQAGSDLGAVRTRAVPEGDHYRLSGQKIFITWGDHNMTENIIHLVLARTPDAPQGVKGISLFVVPKYITDRDGSLRGHNDVHCVSLEHKLGIHGSPTAVLSFGDKEGAIGYLVGKENSGLAYMFTMMNRERLQVGLQGLGIAERAYQQAREYAKDRIQGRPVGIKSGKPVTIIHHPDVRRMLLTMKSQIEGMRAVCYLVATSIDMAGSHPDADIREIHRTRVELLTPVVKGWCTELGFEIASLGVQVHGGMGYIEETGACQHLRDARITTIYEGTTGIQASDLVGRKLALDNGAAMTALIDQMRQVDSALTATKDTDLSVIHNALHEGIQALAETTEWMLKHLSKDPNAAMSGSVNYLMLTGYVCGGWQMARAALVATKKPDNGDILAFYAAKRLTARYYAEQILPKADALLKAIQNSATTTMAMTEEQF